MIVIRNADTNTRFVTGWYTRTLLKIAEPLPKLPPTPWYGNNHPFITALILHWNQLLISRITSIPLQGFYLFFFYNHLLMIWSKMGLFKGWRLSKSAESLRQSRTNKLQRSIEKSKSLADSVDQIIEHYQLCTSVIELSRAAPGPPLGPEASPGTDGPHTGSLPRRRRRSHGHPRRNSER